nr:biotin--[acetyl-CoA-carboxylase] ligase [Lentibacter algarum]
MQSVDSTNAEAARIVNECAGPTWVFSHKQTAARGRRGRKWVEPEGNFAASLLLPGLNDPAAMSLRSFVASLALYDALRAAVGPAARLTLKWPNDVLLSGGKLAGILLESVPNALVIGIGVNLAAAPKSADVEEGAFSPVSLKTETGFDISPEEFLLLVAQAFAPWEARFRQYGFAPVREAWLSRAAKLGETITARTMNNETTGVFETIDAAGHLVLSTVKGRLAIPAADVFFNEGA